MFHREFTTVIGLPPSILAQAAAKACRALSCTIPELVLIDPTDPRGDALHSLLDKVVTAYNKKKVAAKGRRTVARAEEREAPAAPVVAAVQAVAPAAPPLNLQGLTKVTPPVQAVTVQAVTPLISNLVISSSAAKPPTVLAACTTPPSSPSSPSSPEPERTATLQRPPSAAVVSSTDSDSSESEDIVKPSRFNGGAMERQQPPRARQPAPPARQKSRTATRWGL